MLTPEDRPPALGSSSFDKRQTDGHSGGIGMASAKKAARRKAAGRGAKRLVRADKLEAARRHWWRLLVAYLGLWALLLPLVVFVPQPQFVRGLIVGAGLGAMPMLWREFLIGQGIAHREMGTVAERWTADELGRLESNAWFVLHDLPGPHGNVDHVAIGSTRIYVVETVWTTAAGKPGFLSPKARQAEANAQVIRTHLAAQGVVDREVLAILIVWGPGTAASDPEPYRDGETTVVMGAHASVWRERMQQADKGGRPDRVALEAVASPLPTMGSTWSNTCPPVAVEPRLGVLNGDCEISVAEWKKYGKHRLYANTANHDESVGWIDVSSGHLHVEDGAPDNTARELTHARDAVRAADDT